MPNSALSTKAAEVKVTKQRSLLEDRYNEIFRMAVPRLQPHPLPDNMSLEQPSPFETVPSMTTDAVLEDVTVTEIWEATHIA